MRKPDRGPSYRERQGAVTLREIKRPDLVKDPYRVRGQYPKEDGRTGTFDAMNWREARDKARAINKELEEGRAARSGSIKFQRVWKEWRRMREEDREQGDLRGGTLRRDQVKAAHVLKEFGAKNIDAIMSIDVERWAKRLTHEYSLSWGRACYHQVGQVLDYAVRKRYLACNPFRQDKVKLRKLPDERPWVPNWDLVERLIECGNRPRRGGPGGGYSRVTWSNIKTAIALGAGASLRFGEASALKWSDVDFANRVIRVREGQSAEDGIIDPKTPSSKRDVPIIQWVYEALLDHAHVLATAANGQQRRYRPRAAANPTDGLVLRNRDHLGQPIHQPNWSLSFRRFLVRAGLIESVKERGEWHFHVLRKFYISARLACGDNMMQVSEEAGHNATSTTFKHYARALGEPPAIWRHRFQPADPETARMIDGIAITDGAAVLLPSPTDRADADGLPEWVAEAVRLLKGGWRVGAVAEHLGKDRSSMNHRFKELALPPPQRIYLQARDRRYEQLHNEGYQAIDVATMTGTSVHSYEHWLRTYEACVPNTGNSSRRLRQSERRRATVATDAEQKQLRLL
jgi:integrase